MKLAALVLVALAIPASAEPVYRCDATMQLKGWLRVQIDPATLRGTIDRVTTGKALRRDLRVVASRDGDTLTLVFARYGRHDSTSIRGRRGRRPAGEKLTAGKSVVARLVAVGGGRARLHVDGAVDFRTESDLVVTDGYSACKP
ncbi:MAG: hypothetical protein M3680_23320 [Myxococcota bacterium]|nr:hypothetical protein [Myxococcota bacterium]